MGSSGHGMKDEAPERPSLVLSLTDHGRDPGVPYWPPPPPPRLLLILQLGTCTPRSNSSTEQRHDERAVPLLLAAVDEIGHPLSTVSAPISPSAGPESALQSPCRHSPTARYQGPHGTSHPHLAAHHPDHQPHGPRPVVRRRPAPHVWTPRRCAKRSTVGPTRSAAILAPVTAQIYPIYLTSCSHCRHLSCHWAFYISSRASSRYLGA